MSVYAGIDEAGYGPMFGPLLVARAAIRVADEPRGAAATTQAQWPALWDTLGDAVCRGRARRLGRIAINDSKALHTPKAGLRHLETGVLAFAALAGQRPDHVGQWLDALGETTHHDLAALPWYAVAPDRPWGSLPHSCDPGELAVARGILATCAGRRGVTMADFGAAVVFEDRFNRMVTATRNKSAVNFTFVAGHLRHVFDRFGREGLTVVVDHQSGRVYYRELLAQAFPEARMQVLDERPLHSSYHLDAGGAGAMTVSFLVDSEGQYMPVALASMIAKYTRELLMVRFQDWFSRRAPHIKPTAGYALDAQRFWREVEPLLAGLGVEPALLRRMA
jgi:hypothetical protein